MDFALRREQIFYFGGADHTQDGVAHLCHRWSVFNFPGFFAQSQVNPRPQIGPLARVGKVQNEGLQAQRRLNPLTLIGTDRGLASSLAPKPTRQSNQHDDRKDPAQPSPPRYKEILDGLFFFGHI